MPYLHAICRGRAVRLEDSLAHVLATHDYPPVIRNLLAEALCLAALLGSLLKEDGAQATLQAQTENGSVKLLVCDYRDGELRGYVDFDAERLAAGPVDPSLMALFGKGYLAITFDRPQPKGRYQGIVPLEGASLSEAVAHYFVQSEQIPTYIRVALNGSVAGGLLVQNLPEGEEGRERLHVRLDNPEWDHVRIMAESVTEAELTSTGLPLEHLLWRLFSEQDKVLAEPGISLIKGCRCDENHIRGVIAQFPREERIEMAEDDGNITIDCAFCSRKFRISPLSLDN
ncbi:MAG: Hsp33 family molecular chaperone HslO [Parasphingorhabdus sp.]|nr:Hsp33 family molecular chaperone HslO [Parasphingorhabdus sp.]